MATAAREAPPPPVIGRAGRYTIFITPPTSSPETKLRPVQSSRNGSSFSPPVTPPPPRAAVPGVQVPPQRFEKQASRPSSGFGFGFFLDAVARVQEAHASFDGYLAEWFGLNQSKYQWALDDYYENKCPDKAGKDGVITAKGTNI